MNRRQRLDRKGLANDQAIGSASTRVSEESCSENGVATARPASTDSRARTIVGALVIGRQVRPEHRMSRLRHDVGAAGELAQSAAPGTGTRRHSAETGLPGRPRTCMLPSRPCIIGLPGRMAILQNEAPCLVGERLLDEVVIADRGAAEGDQHVGTLSRALRMAATVSSTRSRTMPRSVTSARRARQRRDREAVGGDDLVGTRLFAGRDQLVAGGEDRDPRRGGPGQRMAHRRGKPRSRPPARAGAAAGRRPRRSRGPGANMPAGDGGC